MTPTKEMTKCTENVMGERNWRKKWWALYAILLVDILLDSRQNQGLHLDVFTKIRDALMGRESTLWSRIILQSLKRVHTVQDCNFWLLIHKIVRFWQFLAHSYFKKLAKWGPSGPTLARFAS